MKKLLMITLSLLLFTMLISPVQAKRPGPLDRPLADYNNLTLRQIFEDGQLVTNGDFAIDTNNDGLADGWVVAYISSKKIENGFQYIYGSGTNVNAQLYKFLPLAKDNIYYYRYEFITNKTSGSVRFVVYDTSARVIEATTETSGIISGLFTALASGNLEYNFRIYGGSTAIPTTTYVAFKDVRKYNLTSLGISTATKIEMDNLYSDYLKYKDMMTATDVMLIVGQLGAFVWSLVVSFEVFGFVLWEYALFGIGAGFIGYLALKIIQKKAGDDNGDSD